MKEIISEEEKTTILNTCYYNNYILNLKEKDNKYYNELMKKYKLFRTQDGYTIIFEIEKPTIDSTLWFDDELPIPTLTEELFINYNMHNLHSIVGKDESKTFIWNPYYKCENPYNCVRCSQNGYSYAIDDNTFKRYLTDEEEKIILQLDNENKQNYIDRLKKYYKRYQSKISCCGYWVNR